MAYIALTESLQHEWIFLQRVTENCAHLFKPVEYSLSSTFIPSLVGHSCSELDRLLFSLPRRMVGLNIQIPSSTATTAHAASRAATQLLNESIKGSVDFCLPDHELVVMDTQQHFSELKLTSDEQLLTTIFKQVDATHQRSITHHKLSLSGWLNTLPIQKDHFDLSTFEFRDAPCLRYLKPLLNVPPKCDGYGDPFTTSHALNCRRGGLVVKHKNEIRDLVSDLSSLVWSQVVKEPLIDEDDSLHHCELRADVGISGAWQPQAMSLFDIRYWTQVLLPINQFPLFE